MLKELLAMKGITPMAVTGGEVKGTSTAATMEGTTTSGMDKRPEEILRFSR